MKSNENPNSEMPGSEIKDLVDRFLDGTISDEDVLRLDRVLNDSAPLRAFFLRYCQMHIDLGTDAVVDKRVDELFGAFCKQKERITTVVAPIPPAIPSSSEPILPLPVSNPGATIWQPLLIFTVGFLLAVVSYEVWIRSRAPAIDNGPIAAAAPAQSNAQPSITPVAYLTSANGCYWAGSSGPMQMSGDAVNSGEQLTLLEGIAEFRLSNGVSLSVEGPSTIVMASPNSLILQEGKLIAHVPWRITDFQILAGTNRLMAVDAEFGVQVRGGSVSVHTFSGFVRATLSPYSVNERAVNERAIVQDDDFAGAEEIRPMTITVQQTEAVELASESSGRTTVRRFAADQEQFASRNSMSGQLPINSRYVEAVKRSNPVEYWRFETVKNDVIPNEISTGCSLGVTTNVHLPGDEENHVLELGYAVANDNLASTVPLDHLFNGDFTVELWMKPSHFHRGVLVSLMEKCYPDVEVDPAELQLHSERYGHGFSLGVSPDFGIQPGTMRSSVSHPLLKLKTESCSSNNNLYKLRRWQHVAVVRGSWGMRLYFDGQEVASSQRKQKATLAKGQRLVVGRLLPNWDGYAFVGQLDELAIYDRALPVAEILEHYQAVSDQPESNLAEQKQAAK